MAKKQAAKKNNAPMIITTVLVIVAAIAVIGYQSWGYVFSMLSPNVATVNGEGINKEYLRYVLADYKLSVEKMYGSDMWYGEDGTSTETMQYIQSNMLNSLISMTLSRQECKQRGITLDDVAEEINTSVADKIKAYPASLVKKYGISEKYVRKYVEDEKYNSKLEQVIKDAVPLSGDEFDKNFEEFWKQYQTDNEKTLAPTTAYQMKLNDRSLADQAAALLANGAKIDDMIKSDPNYTQGAEEPVEITSSTKAEIIDAAYNLKEGEVSDIITIADENGDGVDWYYIIQIATRTQPNMEELRETQLQTYKDKLQSDAVTAEMTKLSEASKTTTNMYLTASIKVPDVAETKPTPDPAKTLPTLPPAAAEDAGTPADGTVVPETDITIDDAAVPADSASPDQAQTD